MESGKDFFKSPTIEELAREQKVKPVTDPEALIGRGADLWESDEDLERFLADLHNQRPEAART